MKKILALLSLTPSIVLASGVGLSGVSSSGPLQYTIDATPYEVNVDTVTPSNSTPLPTKLLNGSGVEAGTSSAPVRVDTTGTTTQPVTASSLPLPTGAATAAKQDTGNTSLSSIDGKVPANLTVTSSRLQVDGSGVTQPVSAAALPLPTGAATESTLSTLSGKVPANLTVTSNRLQTDGSGVTQPVSAAALPLPSGASTSANQTTGNTSLSNIDGKLPATLGQKVKASSLSVTLASDQGSLAVTTGGALTGSLCSITNLTTSAQTCTAPANTLGFMIQAPSGNTSNVRFAVGSTATSSVGLRLEPGRSEYLPLGANVSVIAESGSAQEIQIQWVAQ